MPAIALMDFAAFDSSDYPGDAVMAWLMENTNLKACGFYLGPAPSHPGAQWMRRKPTLDAQGWGYLPIFVGRQVIGPGSHAVNEPNGAADGLQACALMTAAGFRSPSVVFLDLENGPPLSAAQRSYVAAWCATVEGAAFLPGVYCSHLIAEDVRAASASARLWAFKVATVDRHHVPGRRFETADVAGCGVADAVAWQIEQNALIDAGKGSLMVDLSVCRAPDPSQP